MRMIKIPAIAKMIAGILLASSVPDLARATTIFDIKSTTIDPKVGGLVGTLRYTYQSGNKAKRLVETASIGRIELKGTSAGKPVTIDSYCVDVFDWLKPGIFADAPLSTLNLTPIRLSELTTFIEHADALVSSTKNPVYSAAAQLGVWEILYETSNRFDLTRGAFSASGGNLNGWHYSATQLANSWLANVTNNVWKPIPGMELGLVTPGAGNQPQIYVRSAASPSAVPEPASWVTMLMGFGLLGAALRQRRKVGQAPSAASKKQFS